jgi:hypothetical protein
MKKATRSRHFQRKIVCSPRCFNPVVQLPGTAGEVNAVQNLLQLQNKIPWAGVFWANV